MLHQLTDANNASRISRGSSAVELHVQIRCNTQLLPLPTVILILNSLKLQHQPNMVPLENFPAHCTKQLLVPPPFHLFAHLKNDLRAVLGIIVLDEWVANPFPLYNQRPEVGFGLRTRRSDGKHPFRLIASPMLLRLWRGRIDRGGFKERTECGF